MGSWCAVCEGRVVRKQSGGPVNDSTNPASPSSCFLSLTLSEAGWPWWLLFEALLL